MEEMSIKQEPIEQIDCLTDGTIPSAQHTLEFTSPHNLTDKQSYEDIPAESNFVASLPGFDFEPSSAKKPSARKVLTLQEKVEVIKCFESTGKSQRQLAAEFKISKTQVMDILRNKEAIKVALNDNILNPDCKRLFIKKNKHKFPHHTIHTRQSSKKPVSVNSQNKTGKDMKNGSDNSNNVPNNGHSMNTSVFPAHGFNDLSLCYGNTQDMATTRHSQEACEPKSDVASVCNNNSTESGAIIELKIEDQELPQNHGVSYMLNNNNSYICTASESKQYLNRDKNDISKTDSKLEKIERIINHSGPVSLKSVELNVEDKLRLILSCKEKKSQQEIARDFGITPGQVFEILRDRDEIEEEYITKRKKISRLIQRGSLLGSDISLDIKRNDQGQKTEQDSISNSSQIHPDKLRDLSEELSAELTESDAKMQEYLDQNWPVIEEDAAISASKKRKRSSISVEEKMLILQHKGSKSLRETADTFGIGKTTVLDIFRRGDEITRAFYDETMNPQRKKMRSWKCTETNYAKVDHAVYLWYRSMVNKGVFLSGPKVQKQAAALAVKLGMTGFKASNGWLAGFCKRHCVSFSSRKKPKKELAGVDGVEKQSWIEGTTVVWDDMETDGQTINAAECKGFENLQEEDSSPNQCFSDKEEFDKGQGNLDKTSDIKCEPFDPGYVEEDIGSLEESSAINSESSDHGDSNV